eukprot:g3677.t1
MTPTTPVYFILSAGADVVADLDKMAMMNNMVVGSTYHNISMGQGQDIIAMERLELAHRQGHWVILNNVQLMPRWLIELEKKLDQFAQEGSHDDFRVFLSSDPAKNIPFGILSRSIKLTNEPPAGLKANLRRALCSISKEEFSEYEGKVRSIIFGLCQFHSIMMERKKFGPKGFNMVYPFSLGDLRDSRICLRNYMDNAPSKIPWADLKYIFGQIIYGGHIVNDWDRLLGMTYLDFYMKDELLDESELFPFVEGEKVSFKCPAPTSYEGYLKHIETELKGETPLAFGLHPNAEIDFRTQQSLTLFATILELTPQSAGDGEDGGQQSPQTAAENALNDIVDRFGDKKFDLDDIIGSIDDMGPYQNVFLQECEGINFLLSEMMRSLRELNMGFAGELTMSDNMEDLQNSLHLDRVPETWAKRAWPSLRSLTMWLNDLGQRIDQLVEWTGNPADIPKVTWLGGFKNPQSFLTAIKQITAQRTGEPLDRLVTQTDMTKKVKVDEIEAPSRDGAYINGFFMDGARWNLSGGIIEAARPKEMFCTMPVINVRSVASEKADRKCFQCPCYKTSQRGPTFIFVAQVKTKSAPARWIMAGVAMLLDKAATTARKTEYSPYLTEKSLRRKPSAIRALQPLLSIPGMISLGGGMPNSATFPFESISVALKGGKGSFDIAGDALDGALQYSGTLGIPSLRTHLQELQRREHGVDFESGDSDIYISTGSQDALAKTFDMLLDESRSLLVEEYTYSGSLAYLQPLGCHLEPIKCDSGGLIPDALDGRLEAWADSSDAPLPRVLYTIPTGSNPTGISMDEGRRRALYDVCCKHDLLIIEDDPYRFLEFGSARTPSLLSMDTDGRVLRFDSFSKLISSGLRLGFCTAPAPLIERLELHGQATNLHTSGISQAVLAGLFDAWATADEFESGTDGFLRHCESVRRLYLERRDAFLASAEEHLSGLAEWVVPTAGMFVWLKLHGVSDTEQFINEKARDAKVILVPGTAFASDGGTSQYVRAAYSTSSPEQIDEALARLAQLLRQSSAEEAQKQSVWSFASITEQEESRKREKSRKMQERRRGRGNHLAGEWTTARAGGGSTPASPTAARKREPIGADILIGFFDRVKQAMVPLQDANKGFIVEQVDAHDLRISFADDDGKRCEMRVWFHVDEGILYLDAPISGTFKYSFCQVSDTFRSIDDDHDIVGLMTRDLLWKVKGAPAF